MIVRKSTTEIDALREAGRVVAQAHEEMQRAAAPGVTPRELDAIAQRVIEDAGATSAFKGYHPHFAPTPFPGVICASVNDVVVHGIPGDEPLQDGDLFSVDLGAVLDGWVGDAARSYVIGDAQATDVELIRAAEEALQVGIDAAVVGNRIGDISHAIGSLARHYGYGLPEGWGGHGVGREMHEPPSVPNEGEPGRGLKLKPGLVIAIEPMLLAGGGDDVAIDDDGWTIRTADGSRAAHVEHTIAVTDDGPQILTLP